MNTPVCIHIDFLEALYLLQPAMQQYEHRGVLAVADAAAYYFTKDGSTSCHLDGGWFHQTVRVGPAKYQIFKSLGLQVEAKLGGYVVVAKTVP